MIRVKFAKIHIFCVLPIKNHNNTLFFYKTPKQSMQKTLSAKSLLFAVATKLHVILFRRIFLCLEKKNFFVYVDFGNFARYG